MLNTVKQYFKLFNYFLISNFSSNVGGIDNVNEEFENSDNPEYYLIKNKDKIKKFIKGLDRTGDFSRGGGADGILKSSDLFKSEKATIEKLLSVLNLDKSIFEKEGFELNLLIDKIDSYIKEKQHIITETKTELKDSEKSIRTKETVVAGAESFFLGKKVGDVDVKEMRADVNIESLNKLLKNVDLGKLINDLKTALETNDLKSYEFTHYFFTTNYNSVGPILKKAGYDKNGILNPNEVAYVVGTIYSVNETQKRVNNLNFEDKLGVLFDYNTDGVLDNDLHYYTNEKEIYDAVSNETEFENLIINLGYNSFEDFNDKFSKNYYATRYDFKERLGILLASYNMLDPGKLLGSKDAIKTHLELMKKYENYVEEEMAKQVKFNKIKEIDKAFYEKIKLDALGVLVGVVGGVGVNLDTKELTKIKGTTKSIIDSISLGFIHGIPGFGFTKNIFISKDKKAVINIGAINFVPYISGALKLKEGEIDESEMKELFPNEMNNSAEMTLAGALSVVSGIGVDVSKIDEKTKEGMGLMKDRASKLLDKIFEKIKAGKNFEESGYEDKGENKKMYEDLQAMYTSAGATDMALVMLKRGALNNYERHLYEQASKGGFKGMHFKGVAFGIADLYPIFGIHFEKHSIDWERLSEGAKPKTRVKKETVVTLEKKVIDQDIDLYNEEAIINTQKLNKNISKLMHSDFLKDENTPGAQALQNTIFEYNNKKVSLEKTWEEYKKVFGSKKIEKYAKEHNSTKELELIRKKFNITSKLEQNLVLKNVAANMMKKPGIRFVDSKDYEKIDTSSKITEKLYAILQQDALTHPKTKGMTKLRNMIRDNSSVAQTWEQFKKVMNYSGMLAYVQENENKQSNSEKVNNVSYLREIQSEIKKVKTDAEKQAILKNLLLQLDNKGTSLDPKDGQIIKIAQGKYKGVDIKRGTLFEYNEELHRTAFFDNIFAEEFAGDPDLLSAIKIARKIYLHNNRNVREYQYGIIQDNGGVGFSGVQVLKNKKTGINKYVGGYHYAKMPTGHSMVEMKIKSPELINKLPDFVLQNIKNQLEDYIPGIQIDDVKEFINAGQIDYKVYFAKDPECLNDKIIVKDFTMKREILEKVITEREVVVSEKSVGTNRFVTNTKRIILSVIPTGRLGEDNDDGNGTPEKPKDDQGEGNTTGGGGTINDPDNILDQDVIGGNF